MEKLRAVSLFSGCGGSDLGAKAAGVEIIFVNDSNADAIKTYEKYKKRLGSNNADVRCCKIGKIKSFPPCDLLIGCYPCQSFTMGGPRSPSDDPRTQLFKEFQRCLITSEPSFFITENVPGLAWLDHGSFLREQVASFSDSGKGYHLSLELVNAKDYGVPQDRRRVIMVGVRKDLGLFYHFPRVAHGAAGGRLAAWASHGEAIAGMPLMPVDEFYDYMPKPFSWWYLSRNRKRRWEEPSFAIQANQTHVPLHPASPVMRMVESNLKDGSKQRWIFTAKYDHLKGHPERPKLARPRRLSWRECARIQTFPNWFEPEGPLISKYRQIGNATPPLLMKVLLREIANGNGLRSVAYATKSKALNIY